MVEKGLAPWKTYWTSADKTRPWKQVLNQHSKNKNSKSTTCN